MGGLQKLTTFLGRLQQLETLLSRIDACPRRLGARKSEALSAEAEHTGGSASRVPRRLGGVHLFFMRIFIERDKNSYYPLQHIYFPCKRFYIENK
jgi:hypothetical protein